MALISDPNELPFSLTWSLTFGNKVNSPSTPYQRCLNFCIRAFGAGVKTKSFDAGVKKGDEVTYLRSDPRFYVPTHLSSFCEVGTLNNEVGVELVIRPIDGENTKTPPAFLERCNRIAQKHSEYQFFVAENGPLQVFIPIGVIADDGEPVLDERADKGRISDLYSQFLEVLDTGAMPIDAERAEALRDSIQKLDQAIVAEDEFCF